MKYRLNQHLKLAVILKHGHVIITALLTLGQCTILACQLGIEIV